MDSQNQNQTSIIVEETTDDDSEKSVFCKKCGHEITKATFVVEPHDHTFRNPAGYSFHVLCYSDAPGAANVGLPTTEASWFKDHAWTFAICNQCTTHLGWWYRGPTTFAGLIATRLVR
ncbi:MAG: cereblon family protein [Candidatus Melainabacteria bacterium]|nr:cereblon family protein [Candidatus Melainabacteria bacterium]